MSNEPVRPRKPDVDEPRPHLQDGEVDVQKVRVERTFTLKGFRIRKIGRGQFYIESKSNPNEQVYLFDSETNECSCHPFSKHGACVHTRHLAALLKQL